MENLTRVNRVAFQAPDLNPVPGHRLVVFKKLGAGQVFHQKLEPGEKIRLRWLESPDSFLTYAVPADPNLRHPFSRPYEHVEQAHSYVLHFDLSFAVESPRLLVEQLESDPLRRLEDEATRLFGGAIRRLPWSVIEQEDEHLERRALDYGKADLSGLVRSNIEQLQTFASALGIALAGVAISRTLSGTGRAVEAELEQARIASIAQHKFDRLEQGHAAELARLEQNHAAELARLDKLHAADLLELDTTVNGRVLVRNSMAQAVADLVKRVSGEIHSLPELHEELPRLEGIVARMRQLVSGASQTEAAGAPALPGAAAKALAAANGDGGLAGLVAAAAALRDGAGGVARCRLGAAALHLIAELSLGEEASEEAVAEHAGEVQKHFRELYRDLTDEQITLLQRLQDVRSLRARLAAGETSRA